MTWSTSLSGALLLLLVDVVPDWSGSFERRALSYTKAMSQSARPLTVVRTYTVQQ